MGFRPLPAAILDPVRQASRRETERRIKNSFWFTRAAHDLRARLYYGDATSLPDALGHFDVAVMAAVLLHVRSPAAIIESALGARRRSSLPTRCNATLRASRSAVSIRPRRTALSIERWWDLSTTFSAAISRRVRVWRSNRHAAHPASQNWTVRVFHHRRAGAWWSMQQRHAATQKPRGREPGRSTASATATSL